MKYFVSNLRQLSRLQLLVIKLPELIDVHLLRVIGTTGRGPKWMVVEYGKLDARYWKTKDPTVMMVSYIEITIMGPLCILWYAKFSQ